MELPEISSRASLGPVARVWSRCTKHALAILLLAVLLKGFFLAVFVPLWEIPDEPAHVQYVQTLVEDRVVPHGDGSRIQFSPETFAAIRSTDYYTLRVQNIIGPQQDVSGSNGAFRRTTGVPYVNPSGVYSPLYYIVEAVPYVLLHQFSISTRVYGMRMVSVGFFVVTVLYAFRLAMLFGRRRSFALAVGALVGFHPMASFLFSGVTNDALLIAVSGMALYEIARWVVGDVTISKRRIVITALLVACAVSSKISAVVFIPLALGAFWYRRRTIGTGTALRYAVLLLGIVGILSGAWIWWSMFLHRSVTILAPDTVRSAFGGLSLLQFATTLFWYRYPLVVYSYWGALGQWFCAPRITYPVALYAGLFVVQLVSAIGLLVFRVRKWRSGEHRERRLMLFFGVSVLLLELLYLLLFYLTMSALRVVDFPNQGRYYFILIGPITILTLIGLESFGGRLFRVSVRASYVVATVLLALLTIYPLMQRAYYVKTTTNVAPVSSVQELQEVQSSGSADPPLVTKCNPPIR